MTKSFKLLALALISSSLIIQSCTKDKEIEKVQATVITGVPEFYVSGSSVGSSAPTYVIIANESNKINTPQDLDFNTLPSRPNELWIINQGTPNTGGSTVMLTNVGTANQKDDYRKDGNAWHFMSMPSAISFSKNGNWATTANVQDANHSGGTFTGPTLWSSDLSIYAQDAGAGTNGSHLDMLHGSPFCMGIETHRDNSFWVFDGYNSQIAFYDFQADHGPGMHDHSDGIIHRYTDFQVKRNPKVPSHLVLDKDKKWLYIVDGGNNRILRMDVTSGKYKRSMAEINEPLAEHAEFANATWEVLIPNTAGLKQPCGIDIKDNRLFVSDYETGEIICFDISTKKELSRLNTGEKGIMGIKIGPDNKIYFVNATKSTVTRIEPN